MSSSVDIQTLLRFLSQDAKLPLATAMSKVKDMQTKGLLSPESISKTPLSTIQTIFPDSKTAKHVQNAAKRLSKKRGADDEEIMPRSKSKKVVPSDEIMTAAGIEKTLALPVPATDEDEISGTILITNRAPLVLAFAVSLLKYTMVGQPLSSRLSLALAVVSVNSRSKAISLGIEKGSSAEEQGWGQGQPGLRIMGRSIRVLKRWDYDPEHDHSEKADEVVQTVFKAKESEEDCDIEANVEVTAPRSPENTALWGLDLEALRSSNGPPPTGSPTQTTSGLPIYSPHSARAYILKSFASASQDVSPASNPTTRRKQSGIALVKEKERNLGLLLGALDLLYGSWAQSLSKDELDRRAWAWYIHVRPEVESGVAGWGGKGQVKLSDILSLRRRS